jgi:hypothetical protein
MHEVAGFLPAIFFGVASQVGTRTFLAELLEVLLGDVE